MRICFEITALTVLLLLELLLGNLGLNLSLTAFVLFYFAVTISLGNALFAAVLCGIVLDALYGRSWPLSPLILTAAVLGGWNLRRYAAYHLLDSVLPGLLIGEIATLGSAWAVHLWGSVPPSDILLWQLIFNGAVGVLLMPVIVLVLDRAASALDLAGFLGTPRSRLGGKAFGSRPRKVQQRIVVPRGDRRR